MRSPRATAEEDGFVPGVEPPDELDGDALVYPFRRRRLLVRADGTRVEVPTLAELAAAGVEPVRRQFLGTLAGRPVASAELDEELEPPAGMELRSLRSLLGLLEGGQLEILSRAVQTMEWDRDHRHCGRCGAPTEPQRRERVRRCPACGLKAHPRLAPAVIVLVERGDEMLLARSPHFPPGMYSTLAGFVEPGESLEQTIRREIAEEVGIEVRDPRYFGSQPWPFPHSLMLGFRARYAGGEISIDEDEIEDARWFRPGALPRVPPRFSIARALIEAFLAERSG